MVDSGCSLSRLLLNLTHMVIHFLNICFNLIEMLTTIVIKLAPDIQVINGWSIANY